MFGGILQEGIPAEHPVPDDRNEKEQDGDPAIGIALHLSAPVLVTCIPTLWKSRVKIPSVGEFGENRDYGVETTGTSNSAGNGKILVVRIRRVTVVIQRVRGGIAQIQRAVRAETRARRTATIRDRFVLLAVEAFSHDTTKSAGAVRNAPRAQARPGGCPRCRE
jgi:hypothetical protein